MRPQSAAGAQEKSSSNSGLSVPPLATASSGVKISPRPATAGLATSRSSAHSLSPRYPVQALASCISFSAPYIRKNHHHFDPGMCILLFLEPSRCSLYKEEAIKTVDTAPHRDARSYFDSFKKEEQRELIAQSTASWLLSPDFRGQAGLPCGLISNLNLGQKQQLTCLFPKEKDVPDIEYREIHQIVRELTSGIFGVNQMPLLRIEPNFDLSSACHLPVAYKNTKVGQVLISVDYAMKSLWHGACVARSMRIKLAERWRSLLNVNTGTGECTASSKNVLSDFHTAGQEFVSSNPAYSGVYQELNEVDPSAFASARENKFFNSYADFVRCVMAFSVSKIRANSEENVIAFDSIYDLTSAITLPDDDFIAPPQLQRLRRRLRHQLKMIRKGLMLDPHVRRNISLLKFISVISLVLVALRRRLMRVPDIDNMLPPIQVDNLRTEAEFPPFAIGKLGDHPCETFTVNAKGERRSITHCHGEIQFDVDSPEVEPLIDNDWCKAVQSNAIKYLNLLMEKPRQEYDVTTMQLDGKDHYVIHIPLTTYYPAAPPQPGWLHARYQMLASLRPKRLLMTDLQLSELFKQVFGFKKALANKTIEGGLKLSACRGLSAPFVALMRKTASSTLLSPDLQGLTLLHYACIHNRQDILSILLSQKPNLNNRRTEIKAKSTRATALIFATRCGALQCVSALLASRVLTVLSDGQGRSAIHHAAAADQTPILRSLLRRHPNLLETPAGGDNATPLLVASSSGALPALKFLIHQGACVTARDVTGDGVIESAVLNFHADIVDYFVQGLNNRLTRSKFEELNVWDTLVGLLKSSSVVRQDAALRCLEVLLHRAPEYWQPLRESGVVLPLVTLLQSNKRRPKSASSGGTEQSDEPPPSPIRSLACSVVCLMSEQDCVRREVANAGAIPTLISLLKPAHLTPRAKHIRYELDETLDERFELQSRSSVVLSDLAHVDAPSIAEHGGIPPLVDLLQLDVVDVLVNAVSTLAALCRGDRLGVGDIQGRIMECGAAAFLVEFLRAKDDALQTATADAIAAVCDKNETIQNEFISIGALKPLVTILRGHCIAAQMKAALAIDSIAECNYESQKKAAFEGAPDALCRLFQIWDDTVKERGACALWSLAGDHPQQQRAIANRIGTKQIIEMLISKSDILQFIGCQAVAAISRNSFSGQERLMNDGTIYPLIRLLRLSRTSRKVTIATLDAIQSMCTSVAHLNNKKSQEAIAEEGAIELLLDRIWLTTRDESMQVNLLLCLAYVVTGCLKNETRLADIDTFGYEIPMELLNSADIIVKFRATLTLALFSFNRLPQQQKILKLGGISYHVLETLLESKDPIIRAGAAFQLVVLARVVSHMSVVDASARGIIVLLQMLEHSLDDDVIIASESYLTSLAHTRAGVPEAIVSSGAVFKLLHLLKSDNDLVRIGAAQALGYLSFNRTASRELMSACRGTKGVYESLQNNLGEDGKISEEFLAEFKRQATVGLPIPEKPPTRNSEGIIRSFESSYHLQTSRIPVTASTDTELDEKSSNGKNQTTRPKTALCQREQLQESVKCIPRPRSVSPVRRVLVTEKIKN